jgi:hypothetical protein
VLTIVSAVLAVVVGLFVILAAVASYKSAKVERRWAATLGSWDEILERHPSTEADGNALELERLSARLGIDTATRTYEGRARPSAEQTAEIRVVRRAMDTYRQRLLERTRREPEPPPAQVAAFLDAHEDDLAAIRRLLSEGHVPTWEMHLESFGAAPIPNLLGHIYLQKLLITDALAKTADGDRQRALRDLEASWTLMQSLWESPILISQLITLVDARMLLGALRQVEDVPQRWHDGLAGHDFRRSFTNALKYEALYWTKLDGTAEYTSLTGIANKLINSVAGPYVKYCLADVSNDLRERLENLDAVRAICDYDLSARQASLDVPIPRWNFIGGIVVPSLGGALDRLARLELDLELTLKLIDLDRARRANRGTWPRALPGGDVSTACPKDRWVYNVSPDREMTLAFNRELSWPDLKGPRLPTRFTVAGDVPFFP